MQYFKFVVEFPSVNEKPVRKVVRESSTHLSGAMRKVYQNYDGINVVRIL